jgi:hypothetical protein
MQYLHDDGTLLTFHHEDPKWMKALSTYFSNYNFKVGYGPCTCVNPLRLANPRNPNKMISFTTPLIIILLFLMNLVVCVHYNFIGFLLYLCYICCADHQIHCHLTCTFFQCHYSIETHTFVFSYEFG